jgi:hypothetical protein
MRLWQHASLWEGFWQKRNQLDLSSNLRQLAVAWDSEAQRGDCPRQRKSDIRPQREFIGCPQAFYKVDLGGREVVAENGFARCGLTNRKAATAGGHYEFAVRPAHRQAQACRLTV